MGMDRTIKEKQPYPYYIFKGWRLDDYTITYLVVMNKGYLHKHNILIIAIMYVTLYML
jgi:hypothetical protein